MTISITECFTTALRAHQAGRIDEAAAAYRAIIEEDPRHPGAWHLLGVIDHQRGRDDLAAEKIARALAINPYKAVYHSNYGVALKGLGRLDEAVAAYREAVRLAPGYADAWSNLGAALHRLGCADEARDAFETALRLEPQHADALYNYGDLLTDCGQPERALDLLRRAHKVAPGRADILNNLGNALLATGRGDEALEAYEAALTLDPDRADTLSNLGGALVGLNREHEAPRWFATPARLRPHPHAWPVRIAALCPDVFPSTEAIERYRTELEAILDAHQDAQLRPDPGDAITAGCLPSFHLAHHGHDDRRIRAKFAALYRDDAPRPVPVPSRTRPRIGFVVTHPHEAPFLRCVAGILNQFSPGRFEPIVLGAERGMKTLRAAITNPEVTFAPFGDQPRNAIARIGAARCDVLYHWEVGTDSLNYLLPFARLAPVQCTSWGIQVTTGVPAIDAYLSSDLVEAPGAEAHYTETLVRLPTLLSYKTRLPRPDTPASLSEFGLPGDRNLYACLQRPLKLHPGFDRLLADILRRDPRGLVVLLKGKGGCAGERLAERFRTTIPDVDGRIVLLPWLASAAYLRLLAQAEVVLDPIPYGSGSSCYDIFSYDLPLVTLPSPYNAGRYALACYRRMGLEDLVAESGEDYVDRAVRLGTDRAYRRSVVARIAAASSVLFEDITVVRAHEAYFETSVAAHQV